MRSLLILVFCLFLLTSCSWEEFSSDINKIKESILSPGIPSLPQNNDTQTRDGVCTTDECTRELMRTCSAGSGPLFFTNMTFNVSINKQTSCIIKGEVIDAPNPQDLGKTLSCELPAGKFKLLPEIFIESDLGFCGGSWYERIPTVVSHDGPLDLPRIAVVGKEVSFNITPQQNIYMQNISITGTPFRNCSLSYGVPIKLPKGQKISLSLYCEDVVGKSIRPRGEMIITYYVRPDFKNASKIRATFTGVR